MIPKIRVVGIDPSISATGACRAVDGVEERTVAFPTTTEWVRPARLSHIAGSVRGFVSRGLHAETRLLVAMESEIFGSKIHTDAAAIQAVLQLTIWELFLQRQALHPGGARFLSVNPSHVKKWLGAKEKDEVLLKVYKVYGREFRDHNEADAFTVAMIGSALVAYEEGRVWPEVRKPQLEVLDKLRQQGYVWEPAPPKKAKRRGKVAQ